TMAHSSNATMRAQVTKVMSRVWGRWPAMTCLLSAMTLALPGYAQDAKTHTSIASQNPQTAEALYLALGSVGLDPSRTYHVRDVAIGRAAMHIPFDDGTVAVTEDVAGQVTGAFFEGDGEVLLVPPDQVERASMALFTGSAILEERFVTAYFRFNDRTFRE